MTCFWLFSFHWIAVIMLSLQSITPIDRAHGRPAGSPDSSLSSNLIHDKKKVIQTMWEASYVCVNNNIKVQTL